MNATRTLSIIALFFSVVYLSISVANLLRSKYHKKVVDVKIVDNRPFQGVDPDTTDDVNFEMDSAWATLEKDSLRITIRYKPVN